MDCPWVKASLGAVADQTTKAQSAKISKALQMSHLSKARAATRAVDWFWATLLLAAREWGNTLMMHLLGQQGAR